VPEDAARPNDKIVYPSGYRLYVWRADEDAERIVLLGHPPLSRASLGQVHLAAPSFHYKVVICAARSLKP
jgi:hypothetical protein